jgi:predicted aldo/keto reductase-like oxidoreductase
MLSAAEEALYPRAGEIFARLSKIDCSGCKYCQPCPEGIDIPTIFELYNFSSRGGIDETLVRYRALEKRADDCQECGFCASQCPRDIDIPEQLKLIARYFDRKI